ncbi:MAG: hypothetical protein JW751_12685 [Polyangiaceae bacterium]|nr:hypothetical protein [Polyangiaceae bacterium]
MPHVDAEVSLPLVHDEPRPFRGTPTDEDEMLEPEVSLPESAARGSFPALDSEPMEEARPREPSVPDLPDLDAANPAGSTDSLLPEAPTFEGADDADLVLGGDGTATEHGLLGPEPGGFVADEDRSPPVADEDRPSFAESEPAVLGVRLSTVRALQDLSVDSQQILARRAKLQVLQPEEVVGAFAVALVVKGDVRVMPAVSDAPCGYAQKGEVVFTRGTLSGIALSVVAGPDGAAVATWDQAALDVALGDSPWVGDELTEVADRFHAMAGAASGPLGLRLDESLIASVFAKAEVRVLLPRDVFVEVGRPVQGMSVVGAGRVEIVSADGTIQELMPGDLVFPAETPASSPAPSTARAGVDGALLLHVPRHETHELLVSVPPLLEVLATG